MKADYHVEKQRDNDMIETKLKVKNLCLKSTIQPVVFEKSCAQLLKEFSYSILS